MENTVENVIELCKKFIWSTQKDSCYWSYAPYLGSFFISQYYLVLRYLNRFEYSKLNLENHKKILLDSQRSDGGWYQVTDPCVEESNLDATIFNYWFLKASKCLNVNSESMEKAREFILKNGGLQSASHMTKIWLCLFCNYEWTELAYIPLFVFRDDYMYKYSFVQNWVSQWVYPHVLPIAYLRHFKKQKFMKDEFYLSELNSSFVSKILDYTLDIRTKPVTRNIKNIIEKMHLMRRPYGTYGAYTVSTLFTLIALQDWNDNYAFNESRIDEKYFKDSINFVEDLYLKSDSSSYLGVLDDGRWWDTLLITLGLLEVGEDKERLRPVVMHFLKNAVQECGGIPYGLDFEYAPDTDDTGVMVLLLAKYYKEDYSDALKKANSWLISMQNNDGGFGAFAKGNNDLLVVRTIAGRFTNSAEIFDESSVDVTAHILEGWAECGYTTNDKHVRNALAYIKSKQTSFGAWEGRWGVNYIYAVGAVVPAIANIRGLNLLNEKWILKSIDWLLRCQNDDGGFGESTLSYKNPDWIGKGISTPSQTAWAILALLEAEKVGYLVTDALEKAINYLMKNFEFDAGRWFDKSSVGTGHRQLLYMQYPVYSIAWPLIALGRYMSYKNNLKF